MTAPGKEGTSKQGMAMTINQAQDEVIEEFSSLDDWMDKYQLLIDLGSGLEPLEERYRTVDNLIDGCQSRVWLKASLVDGKMELGADSDALIVKGIIALLVRVLNHQAPEDVLRADLYFMEEIGLREHLSPTRSNGVLAMVGRIREKALAFAGAGGPSAVESGKPGGCAS